MEDEPPPDPVPPLRPFPARASIPNLDISIIIQNRDFSEHCLVGFLIDSREFHVSRLQYIINTSWHLLGRVPVMGRVNRRYIVYFEHMDDITILSEVPMWVQFSGLTLEYQIPRVARQLGELIGGVVEVDWTPVIPRSICFMRVRIIVPVDQSLLMALLLPLDIGDLIWVDCVYERLYKFCKNCARIGHLHNDCPWTREEARSSIDNHMNQLRERFGINIGIGMTRTHFVNEARAFINRDDSRSTEVMVIDTPKGHDYRPWTQLPMEFEWDQNGILDVNGDMVPAAPSMAFPIHEDPPATVSLDDENLNTGNTSPLQNFGPSTILATNLDINLHPDPPLPQENVPFIQTEEEDDSYPEIEALRSHFPQNRPPPPFPCIFPLPRVQLEEQNQLPVEGGFPLRWVEVEPGVFYFTNASQASTAETFHPDLASLSQNLNITPGMDLGIWFNQDDPCGIRLFNPRNSNIDYQRWVIWREDNEATNEQKFWLVHPDTLASQDRISHSDNLPPSLEQREENTMKRKFDTLEDIRYEVTKCAKRQPIVISVMGEIRRKRSYENSAEYSDRVLIAKGKRRKFSSQLFVRGKEPQSDQEYLLAYMDTWRQTIEQLTFPNSFVETLPVAASDHSPICISTDNHILFHKKVFKFEALWYKNPECNQIISSTWNPPSNGSSAYRVEDELKSLQAHLDYPALREKEGGIRRELENLLECEQTLWVQTARQLWLTNGDRNTKYFHAVVNTRRMKNRIHGIQLEGGQWISNHQKIQQACVQYLRDIYTDTSNRNREQCKKFIQATRIKQLTLRHKDILSCPFTKFEIEIAFFQMDGSKALGPNGFPLCSSRRAGQSLQITSSISLLNRGYMLRELNLTNITLIPKTEIPNSLFDYRPIGLCNVAYKIISKEAWKIDLKKAYDKISWTFMEETLKAMGFPEHWIQMLMQCITTPSLRILVNGQPSDDFSPQCGLRQGDPLSSYLFILGFNVLSHTLNNLQNDGKFKGIKIARQAPRINHLLYADDSIVFFKADLESCNYLYTTVSLFGQVSGLRLNLSKCEIKFSPNTPHKFAKMMASILHSKVTEKISKYLSGSIGGDRRDRQQTQRNFKALHKRLQSWKSHLLSQARRLTLIKSLLTSIPIYHMSYYRLSKKEADNCNSLIARFFWGSELNKKKPHMISWDKICRPLKVGGLVVKNNFNLNFVLLAKQLWRIIQDPSSLFSQVMRSKYDNPNVDGIFKFPSNASPSWKCLMLAQDIIIPKLKWAIGPSWHWDYQKVREIYDQQTTTNNLSILPSRHNTKDTLYWDGNSDGIYTVSDGYRISRDNNNHVSLNNSFKEWEALWKLNLPPKILHFGWKMAHDSLPLGHNLLKRGFSIAGKCVFGCDRDETMLHHGDNGHMHLSEQVLILCWTIYNHRNKVLFKQAQRNPNHVIQQASALNKEVAIKNLDQTQPGSHTNRITEPNVIIDRSIPTFVAFSFKPSLVHNFSWAAFLHNN
ncbi:ribonuclease H [Senna tora]|uniref:Ribonuclease H n=1 Tax=Senna tora TaxID=362788 RepID=A0A834WAC3_9FABA|nr:ribonuclease H [Senna tora]